MDRPILQELVPFPRVWERLGVVERRLLETTTSEASPFLTDIAQHLLRAGGKRYRPLLTQVAAELGPEAGDAPIEAGVAVELVHVGSLYHDDVIDEAEARRGRVSVNHNWTNTIAILAGDFLLARASEVAAPLGEEAVALIARTYATLCEGQILELRYGGDLSHGVDGYLEVIGGKTASLIRTSARLGALTGGAAPEVVEAVSDWAWEMGLVFQIADDVLDLVASEEWLGKPAGSDIREGVYTLPVLLAAEGPLRGRLEELLVPEPPREPAIVEEVISLVVDGGYVDRALDHAVERVRRAEKAADVIDDPAVRTVLSNLDRYLLDRVEDARRRSGR